MLMSPGFSMDRPLPAGLGSMASAFAQQDAHLPREISDLIEEELHCAAAQERRHLDRVNCVYKECDDKIAHVKASTARKAAGLKDRASHAAARAGELEQRLLLAATELRLSRQRISDLEAEQRRAQVASRLPAAVPPSSGPSALELELERLRHAREVLAAQAADSRRDASDARQALGREGAVSQSLQRDLDSSRQRLLTLQGSLADAAHENATLTRDLEGERIRAANSRREQEETAAAHEAAVATLRAEVIRTRQQRDAFGEDAAAANARLRRLRRETGARRLAAAAQLLRRNSLAAALRSWTRGAAIDAGNSEILRIKGAHARQMENLEAEMRAADAAQRLFRERSRKGIEACSILGRLVAARQQTAAARRSSFVAWRSAAAHMLAAEASERIAAAEAAVRAKDDALRKTRAEMAAARQAAESLEAALADQTKAAAAAEAEMLKSAAKASAAATLVRRLRAAALRRVAARQQCRAAEQMSRRAMQRWRRVAGELRAAEELAKARRRRSAATATSPPGSRRGSGNGNGRGSPLKPSVGYCVAAQTMTDAEVADTATQTQIELPQPSPAPLPLPLPAAEPDRPAAATTAEPSEKDSFELQVEAADSPAVRSQPQSQSPPRPPRRQLAVPPAASRPAVDADAALALLGAVPGDPSSLPRLMQALRVKIGEELYSTGEQLLRCVEADHEELYGRQYRPQPVTEVERLQFSARLADATRGRLRWLLVVYLRAYESVKALLAASNSTSTPSKRGSGARTPELRGRIVSAAVARQSLAEKRARRPAEAEDDADLSALRMGPGATPGDRARAARVLRNRLVTLLEDAKDVWMRRRRGVPTAGSPTGAALPPGREAAASSARRVRRGNVAGVAGFGGAAAAAAAAAAIELEGRRRARALNPGASSASARYLDSGAGPRQYWEAVAGSRFVEASWDVPLASLERQMWRLAVLTRCQDGREGLRLKRGETQRKVLDQRIYELVLLYARTVLIWEGTGVPGLAGGGGDGGGGSPDKRRRVAATAVVAESDGCKDSETAASDSGFAGAGPTAAAAAAAAATKEGGGILELTAHDISLVADMVEGEEDGSGFGDDDDGGAAESPGRGSSIFLA